jgi:hypothetical protein
MNRTLTASVNLREMDDDDGGYECAIGRHYSDRSYCLRRYFPGRASRRRLKRLGVTRYRGILLYHPTAPQGEAAP